MQHPGVSGVRIGESCWLEDSMASRHARLAAMFWLSLSVGASAFAQPAKPADAPRPAVPSKTLPKKLPKTSPQASTRTSARTLTKTSSEKLTGRQRVLHALNRLTFGPRPGDVEAVMAKGLDSWLEDQLHPESLDDSALNARLAPYATTRMSLKQIAGLFPPSTMSSRRPSPASAPCPTIPLEKMIFSVQVARLEQQKATQAAAAPGTVAGDTAASLRPEAEKAAAEGAEAASPQDQARAIADRLLALPKDQRMTALESEPPEKADRLPESVAARSARPPACRFHAGGAGNVSRSEYSAKRRGQRTATS